jgi:hypothetical protein
MLLFFAGIRIICRLLLDDGIVIVLYLPLSLAKYSAIFAEVKEYFGINTPSNQHGQRCFPQNSGSKLN